MDPQEKHNDIVEERISEKGLLSFSLNGKVFSVRGTVCCCLHATIEKQAEKKIEWLMVA